MVWAWPFWNVADQWIAVGDSTGEVGRELFHPRRSYCGMPASFIVILLDGRRRLLLLLFFGFDIVLGI